MKKCLITTTIIIILFFAFSTSINANAAIFYPSELVINIDNLPQNKKIVIEVRVITEALDIIGEDPRLYARDAYEKIARESDGTFIGPKYIWKGFDSETNKAIYEKKETTYYYKTLVKESISNKNKEQIRILTGNINLSSYRDIIILINNKPSNIADIGTMGKRYAQNYFSLNYDTLEINRNVDLEHKTASIYNYKQHILLSIILCITITLIIEFILSKLFRIKNGKVVLKVNLLTQSVLHIITIIILSVFHMTYNTYIYIIILLESIVILLEFLMYQRKFKDITTNRLICFSTIANLCSFLVSPLIYMMVSNLLII